MNIVTQRPIRLFCDVASPNQALEQFTKYPPVIVRGAPTVFQLGLGRLGVLFAAISAEISSLTVQVRASSDPSSEVLMEKTIVSGFTDDLAAADWNAGDDQHCEVGFTAEETNQTAGDKWLAIWFNDQDGNPIPVCFGKTVVKESGAGTSGEPAEPAEQYFTRTEALALFAKLLPGDGTYRVKVDETGAYMQLKDVGGAGGWRTVWLDGGVLQVGPLES